MHRHTGIVVRDIKKQIKFYQDFLGFEIYYYEEEKGNFLENLIGVKNAKLKVCKLGKDNKVIVELLQFNRKKKLNPQKIYRLGYTHIALEVKDIDNLYKRMLEDGINFVNPPLVDVGEKHKVCFCMDYENNFIELVEILEK